MNRTIRDVRDRRRKNEEDDPGNIILLGIGLWIFLLFLVLILASGIRIYQARSELYARGDELALILVQEATESAYYGEYRAGYDESQLATRAARFLGSSEIRLVDLVIEGETVSVSLSQTVRLPLIPDSLSTIDEVEVAIISSARLRPMP